MFPGGVALAVVNARGGTTMLTSRNAAGDPGSVAGVGINGGATHDMAALARGTCAGMLFYQARLAANQAHTINGDAESTLWGALNFSMAMVQFAGTMGITGNCIQMVAWRLVFRGASNLECLTAA